MSIELPSSETDSEKLCAEFDFLLEDVIDYYESNDWETKLINLFNAQVEEYKDSSWVGYGGRLNFREFRNNVLPKMNRLSDILTN